MNIAMFTNDYEPVIGGVSRSISTFEEDLRRMGHDVLVVTLAFRGAEESTETVFRLPALKEVGGTQFSAKLPVPSGLAHRLDAFAPDLIHSHHPFMVGDTALRVARRRGLPLVFTHHTLYERYTYLFSRDSRTLERIAMAIATEYANLCDRVVAPTKSIERLIRQRGVRAPITVIPTGIDVGARRKGRGADFRRRHGLAPESFVVGYLGRVVEAKNMAFLMQAVVKFLQQNRDSWFLVVGDGESTDDVRRQAQAGGVEDRVVMTGSLTGQAVVDAYAAMDTFAFASTTETQGIVLIESLCAGVPVVALDAPGTRDSIADNRNGLLLAPDASCEEFAAQLHRVKHDADLRCRLSKEARRRARDFDRKKSADRLMAVYAQLCQHPPRSPVDKKADVWPAIQEGFVAEWDLLMEKLAVIAAVASGGDQQERPRQE